MTTMQIDRATVEQALEALESVYGDSCDALHALRAALAQQAEPTQKSLPCPTPKTCQEHCCGGWCIPRAALAQEQDPEPVPHQHEWFRAGGWELGRIRCFHCGKWGKETF